MPRLSTHGAAVAARLLDLLFTVAALAAIAILVAGHLGFGQLELRSAMPAVGVMMVVGILRLGRWPKAGFFFSHATPEDMNRVARMAARWITGPDSAAHPNSAYWYPVVAIAVASFLLKIANAFAYRGFFSGDDVEVLEWVLSRLQGWHYVPWALRNPFFPFTFVFPPLWLAQLVGVRDTWALVLLARVWMAAFSSLAVVFAFLIGKRLTGSSKSGAFVAAIVGFGGYFIRFSSGVLPRSAVAVFVVAALWALVDDRDGGWRPALAGVLVGLGAAARFSDAAIALAAAATLAGQRRWRSLFTFALGAAMSAAAAICGADLLFTGNPLASTEAIWRYTLIEGASSRGFQPWFSYIGFVLQILTPLGAVFTCFALRGRYLVLWTWCAVPTLLLSLLPHKEIRYLTSLMPVFIMLLSLGALEAMKQDRPARKTKWWSPAMVALLLLGTVLLQLDSARFRRSGTAVEVAQQISARWRGEDIALEQLWRCGGRLFLPKTATITDLEPPLSTKPSGRLSAALTNPRVGFLGLTAKTFAQPEVASAITKAGFCPADLRGRHGDDYRLYVRRSRCEGPKPSRP